MKKYILLLLLTISILLSGCNDQTYTEDVISTLPVLPENKTTEIHKNDIDSTIPFDFIENTDSFGFIVRKYYDEGNLIAESFGCEIDDYYIDFDNDGFKELLCNCEYEVDGHREVYVYKNENPTLRGEYVFQEEDLPGLNYWGVNAVQTFYDPSKKAIIVSYYDTIRELDILLPLKDFDSFLFEKF